MPLLNKRTVVAICDEEYNIKSDIPPEEVRKVAEYVDIKMREIKQKARNMPLAKAAVLACLNMTEELFAVQKELKETKNIMEDETKKIINLLDEFFINLSISNK